MGVSIQKYNTAIHNNDNNDNNNNRTNNTAPLAAHLQIFGLHRNEIFSVIVQSLPLKCTRREISIECVV